jgi:phosphatidylglycerol:prolipoprotein diacylglycerol transferase
MIVVFHILGMLAGVALIAWRFRRAGFELGVRFFVGFIVVILIGVTGTRVLYVMSDVGYYVANWREIFSVEGTIIQGALIFGLVAVIGLARVLGIPFWKLADLVVPGVALGQAIGRVGCLATGCCFGLPVHLPGMGDGVVWTYPTQTMHAVANLLIMVILLAMDKPRTKPFDGFLALMYALLFSAQRYLIDLLRATGAVFADTMPFAGIRVARVISIATIVVAAIVLVWKWNRARRDADAGEPIDQ